MTDYTINERDVHALLQDLSASIHPTPLFSEELRTRLYQQLDRTLPNDQMTEQPHMGVIKGCHSREEPMQRKNSLLTTLANVVVVSLLLALIAIVLLQNHGGVQTAAQPGTDAVDASETPGDAGGIPSSTEEPQPSPTPTPIPPPTVSGPDPAEDETGLKASAIFYSLPGDVAYAYSTLTVEDGGRLITEMRFYRNEYFFIVTEQPDDSSPLPEGQPLEVGGFSGTIQDGQSGTAILTGTQLQDGVERPIRSHSLYRDGEIGADRLYPDTLDYQAGYRVTWQMSGLRYQVLSNLPLDHVEAWTHMLTQLADGTLSGAPPMLGDTFNQIRDILADEVYYGSNMLEALVDGQTVTEYRYYGNRDFFMISAGPAAVVPLLSGAPIQIAGYEARLTTLEAGTVDLLEPSLITLGGIGQVVGGGGGGGGGGLTELDEKIRPQIIVYEDAIKVQWTADGITCTILTDRDQEDARLFAEHVIVVMTGGYTPVIPTSQ
jgi:hypothetical protein